MPLRRTPEPPPIATHTGWWARRGAATGDGGGDRNAGFGGRSATRAPSRAAGRSWSNRLAWIVLAGGLTLVAVRASVATVVRVHGDGMAPSIIDGDAVLLIRHGTRLDLGDVVIYDPTPRHTTVPPHEPTLERDNGRGEHDGRPSGAPRTNEALRNASIDAGGSEPNTSGSRGGAPTAHGARTPDQVGDLDSNVDDGGVFTRAMQDVEHGVRLAVVDTDELEGTWAKVQRRSGVGRPPPRGFRIGRVLARPGDRVTFRVPGVPLGLEVNGAVLVHAAEDPVRLQLAGEDGPRLRASVREALVPIEGALSDDGPQAYDAALSKPWSILPGDRHERVELETNDSELAARVGAAAWAGMDLPADDTPIEIVAPGYLVLADHRDDGACCDSRVLGFLPPEALRGEVVARIAGDARKAPQPRDGDATSPPRRGPAWLR